MNDVINKYFESLLSQYIETDAFKVLLQRYAGDKQICNCGDAYYDENSRCASGCSANCIYAKRYVAHCIINEFNIDPDKRLDQNTIENIDEGKR